MWLPAAVLDYRTLRLNWAYALIYKAAWFAGTWLVYSQHACLCSLQNGSLAVLHRCVRMHAYKQKDEVIYATLCFKARPTRLIVYSLPMSVYQAVPGCQARQYECTDLHVSGSRFDLVACA